MHLILRTISKWISQYSINNENVILVGDFNCSLLKDKDKSLNSFKNLQKHFDFVDLWAKIKPEKNGFTWCDGSDTAKNQNRLCFFNAPFCYKPKKIYLRRPPSISNVRMSDHIALICKCEIFSNSRRKGYWKLNTSVLLDIQYCKIINDFLLNLPDDI